MKRVALVLCLAVVAVATGQYVERTIWLPDSFSHVREPNQLAYNSGNNTIYVASPRSDDVVVLDGVSHRKVAAFGIEGGAREMLYVADVNKLYCAPNEGTLVHVVDAAANRVVGYVELGSQPWTMCYNPLEHKLYCATRSRLGVCVLDVLGDSLLLTVPLPEAPRALCCNTEDNKVYAAEGVQGRVWVIDGAGDTLLTSIYVSESPEDALYNPLSNKAYVPDEAYWDVGIVDAGADTLIKWIGLGGEGFELCLNTRHNKVYLSDHELGKLHIVCGWGDSLIPRIDVGAGASDCVYDSVNDVVYVSCADVDSVVVVDGSSDTIVARIGVSDHPVALCHAPRMGRLYSANESSSDVGIVAVPENRLERLVGLWFGPTLVSNGALGERVYCGSGEVTKMAVIDVATRRLLSQVPMPGRARAMQYASELHKLYCLCDRNSRGDVIGVFYCRSDSLAAVPLGNPSDKLAYRPDPHQAKVYALHTGFGYISVLDAVADSLLDTMVIRRGVRGFVYAPEVDRLVAANQFGWVVAIDCSTDVVVDSLPIHPAPRAILHMPGRGQVAAALSYDTLSLIDPGGMAEVARLAIGVTPGILVYCRPLDKLYCCEGAELVAVAMDSLRVVGRVTLPNQVIDMAYDSIAARLLCVQQSGVASLVDCRGDSVLSTQDIGEEPGSVVWNPFSQRFFVTDRPRSAVMVVADSVMVGVEDKAEGGRMKAARRFPTVARVALPLTRDCSAVLMDITGRKVMDLQPGENDIRGIAPGVYFVRERESGGPWSEGPGWKVIVQR